MILVISVCPSAQYNSAPVDQLSWNFTFKIFSKICGENSSWNKIVPNEDTRTHVKNFGYEQHPC